MIKKNNRKSLMAILLAASLSFGGCSNSSNHKLERRYYDYFDSYDVEYLHPEYLTSDEDLQEFKEMLDSTKKCTYNYNGTVEEMVNRISQNTDKYISEHPDAGYVNATNLKYTSELNLLTGGCPDSYSNCLEILCECQSTLECVIKKLINKELSSDTNEDLCRMQDLVIILDTTTASNIENGPNSLAAYIPEENKVVIYLNSFLVDYDMESNEYINYDINKSNSIPYNQIELIGETLAHELNHLRAFACNDRIENGQTYNEISYDNNIISSILESSCESAIFDETDAVYSRKNSYDDSESYYLEREFENELLLLSLTDNSTTLDDYYSSIFNSDWNSLIKFFNLKSDDDIKSFLNILKSNDALFARNNIAFAISNNSESMKGYEIKIACGTNYRMDILRLSLRNLIDYNINSQEKLTPEEIITLEKLIVYKMCDNADIYKLDANGNLIKDKDGYIVSYYDPSFIQQLTDLEGKFKEYVSNNYNLSLGDIETFEEQAYYYIMEMNLKTSPNSNYDLIDYVGYSLIDKFPKLLSIIPGLNFTYEIDSNYNKALTKK